MGLHRFGRMEERVIEVESGELNSPPSKMKILSMSESWGDLGHMHYAIIASLPRELSENGKKEVRHLFYDLEKILNREARNSLPSMIDSGKKWREESKQIFADAGFGNNLYFMPVENEYDKDDSEHFPWFKVFTNIGMFKIGWRKRVINLDWEHTSNRKAGEDLFPNEDVTKGQKYENNPYYIHCWNEKKAVEYLKRIKESATNP